MDTAQHRRATRLMVILIFSGADLERVLLKKAEEETKGNPCENPR